MIRRAFVATLALSLCAAVASAESSPLPVGKPVAGDAQDFVFLDAYYPVFLRLHVQIDGVGFRRVWQEYVEEAFEYADVDGDGKLEKLEFQMAASRGFRLVPAAGFAAMDASPRDGHVDREEWRQWIRKRSGKASDVNYSYGGQQQRQNQMLFSGGGYWMGGTGQNPAKALQKLLDVNRDTVLTKGELTAAWKTLRRLDLNDDEIIAADELNPYTNPLNGVFFDVPSSGLTHQPPQQPARLFAIPSTGNLSNLVQQLLKVYDGRGSKVKDRKLSRKEMALDQAPFEAADADGDGHLDTEELERFLRSAKPRLALLVRLGEDAKKLGKFARVHMEGETPKGMPLHANADGSLTVILGAAHLQFSAATAASVQAQLKSYEAQFKQGDRDNNGYVDKKEAARWGFASQFTLMDRDKNDMVYADEMMSFMKRALKTSRARVSARGTDGGKLLFDVMDADRDRRLSQRELAAAPGKLPLWDRNGDGKLAADEIPHQYSISIARGSGGNVPVAQQLVVFNAGTGRVVRRPKQPAGDDAPAWFTKMDRNRDGDVSPREFLGSAKDFRRFDANGDGLIDKQEAARK